MNLKYHFAAVCTIFLSALAATSPSDACTRVVYEGDSSLYIIGRTLDWKTPIPTNLYVYPRGMEKVSSTKPDAFKWKSKYGAVYAVGYDAGITEGMNEKGLSVNSLFCKTAQFSNDTTANRRPISLSVFVAWILDNCATTKEAKELLQAQNFTLSGSDFDGGTETKLHFGITDRSGETAIVEFTDGVLHIYNPGDIHAMSNDPNWPEMQAIVNYWNGIGGINMLPGTVKSPDRCIRGNFFVNNVDKVKDADLGASIVRSVMANVSVPYLYTVNGEPNVSSTQWRSISNLRDLRYYFDIVTNSGFYYIDLSSLDLRKGAPVLKLTVADHPNLTGCANTALIKVKPFTPSL